MLEWLLARAIHARAMFGSYRVTCDGRIVMTISDDQVYPKRSPADRALQDGTKPAPSFEGATDWCLVPEETLQDRDWLRDAAQAIADLLSIPKPKR